MQTVEFRTKINNGMIKIPEKYRINTKRMVDIIIRDYNPQKEAKKGLLKLLGKVEWEGDLDEMRKGRI